MLLQISRGLKKVGRPDKSDANSLRSGNTFICEVVVAVVKGPETVRISKQHSFGVLAYLVALKVFLQISFQLTELVYIDGLVVLPLGLPKTAPFGLTKTLSNSDPPSAYPRPPADL